MFTQGRPDETGGSAPSSRALHPRGARKGALPLSNRRQMFAVPTALALILAPALLAAQRPAPAAFAPPTAFAPPAQALDTVGRRAPEGAPNQGGVPLADTLPRRRPVAVEYSDWYSRRLRVHQIASWTMLPLFVAQYSAGQQLLDKGRREAPSWARDLHGPLAGATGVLFGVNTLTGAWNLWDARRDPQARAWRTTHAVLMLLADAGFALTPAFAEDADEGGERDAGRLRTHRRLAVTSMGVAAASWIMMLPPFRHE